MSRFFVLVCQLIFLFSTVICNAIPNLAMDWKENHKVTKMTCFTLEDTSNDFGIVQMNFQTSVVSSTFYIAGLEDPSATRTMTEYDDKTISNLEKAGGCYPMYNEIASQGSIRGIEFSDSCLVKDPTQTIISSGIHYKLDFVHHSGSMIVRNYLYDTSLFSERRYSFYHCFEPED